MKNLNMNSSRIFGLDVMRATAIMMVIIGHLHWIFMPSTSLFMGLLSIFGFLGVEFFFVLSGFLIGRIILELYLKEDFTIKAVRFFLKRRWYRTLPNYYLLLIINIAIAFYMSYPIDRWWNYFIFQHNFASPLPLFFSESWSLSVEEYVYLLLPFSLLLLSVLCKSQHKLLVFLLTVISLMALSIIAKIYYNYTTTNHTINQWNTGLKSVVIYRLDSILVGVVCAWIAFRFSLFWQKYSSLLFISGSMLIGFIFVGFGYFQLLIEDFPFYWNVLYLPILSIAIGCLLPFLSSWNVKSTKGTKPIIFISKISYSMYLLHYGIVLQLMKHFIVFDNQNLIELTLFIFTYLLLTIFLSYLLYRFYEKPIMDKRDN